MGTSGLDIFFMQIDETREKENVSKGICKPYRAPRAAIIYRQSDYSME
jgi:hypothetical protein